MDHQWHPPCPRLQLLFWQWGSTAVILAIDEGPQGARHYGALGYRKGPWKAEAQAAPKNVHRRVTPNQFHS